MPYKILLLNDNKRKKILFNDNKRKKMQAKSHKIQAMLLIRSYTKESHTKQQSLNTLASHKM
jgi:hypothetical protein